MSLSEQVKEVYSGIADGSSAAPFASGRPLALEVGYPRELLDLFPGECVDRFCGVSNPSVWGKFPPASQVLDLGCGAGLDSFVAARRGANVVSCDFSSAMVEQARRCLPQAGNPVFQIADATRLPFADGCFDIVMFNGLLNLNPQREAIVREAFRVLRPGGLLQASEIVLTQKILPEQENWFT